MKIFKKIIIISLIIIIIIYSFVPPKVIKATVSVSEAGNAIAQTALDFLRLHKDDTIYNYGGNEYTRGQAYMNKRTSGIARDPSNNPTWEYKNKYAMDCVGFVSMIIHCATGLGPDDGFTYLPVFRSTIRWC